MSITRTADQERRIVQAMEKLVEAKRRELKITQQSTWVTRAVMQPGNTPEHWPLEVPWPDGYVIWIPSGRYEGITADQLHDELARVALHEAPLWSAREEAAPYPVRGRAHMLANAYIWSSVDRAEKYRNQFCPTGIPISVEKACMMITGLQDIDSKCSKPIDF